MPDAPATVPAGRRSDRTRAAILAAARSAFSRDGYERATIRGIAGEASIDPSLVMRYYGSKDGLFAAATAFDLRLPTLEGVAPERAAAALVGHFLERWEGGLDDGALLVLLRSAVTNEVAADRLRSVFAEQVLPAVASVTGDDGAELRAGLVATQMLGLALCRYFLHLPPVAGLSGAEVVALYAPLVQRCLSAPLPTAAP
jgi:AcrR family transcriptional regulator